MDTPLKPSMPLNWPQKRNNNIRNLITHRGEGVNHPHLTYKVISNEIYPLQTEDRDMDDNLTHRFNIIETLDYTSYRQTLIDMIEVNCGPLLSIPYERVSTVDLITLAEAITNKYIELPKTFNVCFPI